jgi:hypothetical protein
MPALLPLVCCACCVGAHQGDWAWEDGTPFDFVHVQSEFANIDCTYCGDGGYHLMSDETRIAAVPSKEHWDQGMAAAQIRGHMSHETAHNVTGIATYQKWGSRHGKKLDRGWYDWGHGEAELAVVCQVDDPPENAVCENLSGFQYTDGAASCYLTSQDQADISGRRRLEESGGGSDALEEEVHVLSAELTEMKAMLAQLLERQ